MSARCSLCGDFVYAGACIIQAITIMAHEGALPETVCFSCHRLCLTAVCQCCLDHTPCLEDTLLKVCASVAIFLGLSFFWNIFLSESGFHAARRKTAGLIYPPGNATSGVRVS